MTQNPGVLQWGSPPRPEEDRALLRAPLEDTWILRHRFLLPAVAVVVREGHSVVNHDRIGPSDRHALPRAGVVRDTGGVHERPRDKQARETSGRAASQGAERG